MASATEKSKKTTLQLRIPLKQKALLSKAAKLRKITLSQFVLAHSDHAAREVLSTQTEFHLLTEQWNQFCEALDQPARTIPALRCLLTERTLLDE
ncbi:MAG: DUF1778 domain-containing protein [Gammaproteobacteria bacterium]|nr:DUF1778 domain-containing protein [Gammaproteobacteria bacterium]MBP9729406.1 DUF1778 domain-containing protein [Gammaproteobacteria bacterium]